MAEYRDRPAQFLEVGSFEGASAIWLLNHLLTHPEARLTCVDNNALRRGKRLLKNLAASGQAHKADILWIDSRTVRTHVPDDHFDFVYVDGSHSAPNVLYDVVNAFLICKPGGVVGCDDYEYTVPENGSCPKEAIDTFLALAGDRVQVTYRGYQLWFRKRQLAARDGICGPPRG